MVLEAKVFDQFISRWTVRRTLRKHSYNAERKSESLQQNMNGSIAALREVNGKVTLMYLLNEREEGETTAGKMTMGAQQSNDVATTIATALADLFQNGKSGTQGY